MTMILLSILSQEDQVKQEFLRLEEKVNWSQSYSEDTNFNNTPINSQTWGMVKIFSS